AFRQALSLLLPLRAAAYRPGHLAEQGQRLPVSSRQCATISRRRSPGRTAAETWFGRRALLSFDFWCCDALCGVKESREQRVDNRKGSYGAACDPRPSSLVPRPALGAGCAG